MQTNVSLPQVELTMDQALVARWLVEVGSAVQPEQPLLEVETQKAVTPVPSPCQGYVRKLLVKEGESIREKALLCVLTQTAEESFVDPMHKPDSAAVVQAAPPELVRLARADDSSGAIKATPAARRAAKELGVDMSAILGTGPGGRITEQDVRAAEGVSQGDASDASGAWAPLSPARLALIAQMQKSLAEIPQIHLFREMDVTTLSVKIVGVTVTHRLVAAVARALRQHSALRTVIADGKTKVEPVSVAVAMDTPHGLVAPVLRRADRMSVAEIVAAVGELRSRAQSSGLQRHELIDAPFAVTNLGMLGVDFFSPFVFHGQTAVLSVGRMTDASDGTKTAWFGLAADHRVVDGAEGARFLQTLQAEIHKA